MSTEPRPLSAEEEARTRMVIAARNAHPVDGDAFTLRLLATLTAAREPAGAGLDERLRVWVDGPPTDAMVAAREDCIDRLGPESLGRWAPTDFGGRELARAAWECGWDAAALSEPKP